MRLKTKKTNNPKKRKANVFSDHYYYSRKLYFEHKITALQEIIHVHNSFEIAEMVSREFSKSVPDSTIRRWAITPDKDFEGRTWKQEWTKRINDGILNAIGKSEKDEHLQISSLTVGNNRLTPLQSITEMSKKSLLNDIEIAHSVEKQCKRLLCELDEEYTETGTVNTQKLKILAPIYAGAKERLYINFEKLKEIESTSDREMLGRHVALKDPMARERVRRLILSFMTLVTERSIEATPSEVFSEDDMNL